MSVFLTISDDRVIYRGDFFFMIYDAYPVSKNHLLIISNELREDYFSLTEEEQQELPVDITRIINGIQEYESKQYIPQEDADIMRRGITALQTGRQSTGAAQKSVLQLLTMLMPK